MSDGKISFSPVIVGAMRLGKWGVNMSTSELEDFIDQCVEFGLTDFDHADIYGHYMEEANFGKVLKRRKDLISKIEITTKCGIKMVSENRPYHSIKSYDSTKKHILKSVENSLKSFGVDQIKLLLLHRPDYLMNPEEVASAFEELKKAGKVSYFGVSNFRPSQVSLLSKYITLVNHQVEMSLMHKGVLEDGTLDQCLQDNIRPTAWSPLGGGEVFSSINSQIQYIQKVAWEIGEKHHISFDQVLFAWLAKHPSGIVPVTGTSKITRIKSAATAMSVQLSCEEWYQLLEASRGHEVA